jgi:hypothetical protein
MLALKVVVPVGYESPYALILQDIIIECLYYHVFGSRG